MKYRLFTAVSVFLFTVWIAMAQATTNAPNQYQQSDIAGTWQGTGHTINSRGKTHSKKELVIEVDEQGLITGTSGWELIEGAGGFQADKPVQGDNEKIIGVFRPDSGEIHLVEMAENGILHGKLISKDQLRMVLMQAGEKPAASTYILNRVQK